MTPGFDCQGCDYTQTEPVISAAMDHARETGHKLVHVIDDQGTTATVTDDDPAFRIVEDTAVPIGKVYLVPDLDAWQDRPVADLGVDQTRVSWPDGDRPHVIQTDYQTSVQFTVDLVPDLDGLWEQVARLASRQAADELLIKEMATILEDNPDRTSGYLIYREGPDGGWQIVQSPFIPRDKVYLCRVGLPDLGVKREPDGKYQGYRQKQTDPDGP